VWLLAVIFPSAAHAQGPLERAREELGIERPLPARWPLPNGDLEIDPSELVATSAGATIRFTVRLEQPEPGGALFVGLPGTGRGRSGLRGLRGPARLEIAFRGEGLEHSASVEHVGLAAGTYTLPLTWHDGRRAGRARLRVLAANRERVAAPAERWRGMDVTGDELDQSEAFSVVAPGEPGRIAVAANPDPSEPTLSAWLSRDGVWTRHAMPETLDVPGSAAPEPNAICCDPILAATAAGDIWVGAITEAEGPPGARSRIAVNRLPATGREGFAPQSTGLPVRTSGMQDKPMMTAAPDGRLLVVWLEPDAVDLGGLNVVLSACHTALGPEEDPGSWCESADHWTEPVAVTPAAGSYTYPDVAAAPGGAVHVTWWDYSSMENGIRGATCATPCAGSFEAPRTIALLDSTGLRPLPFGCPIPVAPGGRVGAVPSVEAAPDGHVWVAWGDLRGGSGTTRCEDTPGGGYTAPRATHMSWDAFATSAAGALPGDALPSAEVGTPLIVDGDEGVASSSDDFLPWLAADPVYGELWASAYSTGHDPERQSAHYVAMSLARGPAEELRVGPANRVSAAASGFAGAPCCTFGNDFGDYAGLAVTDRVVVPAWIDNATGGDGDLWTAAGRLATVGFDLDTDGMQGTVAPGETLTLRPRVRNTGTRATGGRPEGLLESVDATVVRDRATWPALEPDGSATPAEDLQLRLPDVLDCRRPITARLTVGSPEGTEVLPVAIPVPCPPGTEPPPDPFAPGPETPARPAAVRRALSAFSVVPGQRLETVLRRGLLVSARCTRACRATVAADLGAGMALRLSVRRRVAYAAATFGTSTRRVRLPVRARARRLLREQGTARLRVRIFASGVGRDQPRRRTRYVTLR
jgi:hypothetical protein